jgi:hypothetical protein
VKVILLGLFFISNSLLLIAEEKYLIITTEEYYQSEILNDFVRYRSNDFDTELVINTNIGINSEDFKQYLFDANPDYVLLVGHHTDFPAKIIPYPKPVESFNFWVSEKKDSLFQINIPIGLFFVENLNELENIINKTIKFEENIDYIPNKLYTHSGSIEPLEPWPLHFNDEILSEMYLSFFKNNGYAHQHETSLDDTPNDALKDVEAINNGIKYMIYHGHGYIQKWSFGMGVPGITYLNNTKYFPIVFSASCLTGTFTGKIDTIEAECFATKMLSSENGAAAFIGAYNLSSKGQNPLLYGFCKYVNNNVHERLGDALLAAFNNTELPQTVKKYHPHVSEFEYNRARLQFHLFGDPALLINNPIMNISENKDLYKKFVFPNPASDYIEIINPSEGCQPSEGSKIKIYNTFGECVMNLTPALSEGEGVRMNIEHLPAGVYFVRICNNFQKFVKM